MAMRQWDGGPKAVKADGGGGFLGGAIAGLTGGIATLSLEQFKEEQQRETARIQREALKLMKDEEYNRGRQDKATDRDEERKYQGLLRAEERGYEAADEEAKRQHEIELQELKNAGVRERSDEDKLSVTERNDMVDSFTEEAFAMAGVEHLMDDPNLARREIKRGDKAHVLETVRAFEKALRGAKTRDEAVAIMDTYLDILLTDGGNEGGLDDAPATAKKDRKPLSAFD